MTPEISPVRVWRLTKSGFTKSREGSSLDPSGRANPGLTIAQVNELTGPQIEQVERNLENSGADVRRRSGDIYFKQLT
ncbi:hypothetical protein FJZ40_05215 [Candidatus Shapirobacteria bacterium]|nr:hypothetical protein [Candidatus Shapirobacteria bacterium]